MLTDRGKIFKRLFGKDLSSKFCFRPWYWMELVDDLRLYNCCPSWVNGYNYGAIHKDFDFEDVWNGRNAIKFRKSILKGNFKYCNREICPLIQSGSLPDRDKILNGDFGEEKKNILKNRLLISENPNLINICIDRSCNIKCPSCRTDFYFLNENVNNEEYVLKKYILEKLSNYLHKLKNPTRISVTGSGDPFASKLLWNFLTQIDGRLNPNIQLQLQTNGLLFTPENWEKLYKMHNNDTRAIISLDAGTELTYNITRRGGDWKKLMKNIEYVSDLHKEGKIKHIRLDFVCQKLTYKEIPLFIEISKKYNYHCSLQRIINWGSFTSDEFKSHNITDKNHPEHEDFLLIINKNYNYDKIDWGNLSEFRKT